jgi:hypothetical protein
VVKTYDHRLEWGYPFDSEWPDAVDSVADVYRHRHYRDLFERGFDTHVVGSYARSTREHGLHYFTEGVTDAQYRAERAEYREAARHLLSEYRGTGKTFVLQHWEGDWALVGSGNRDVEPTSGECEGMTRWLRARQEGVERARREVDSDVAVLHAAEVNLVRSAVDGDRRAVTDVVPDSGVDLVSYSAYDAMDEVIHGDGGAATLRETLEFVHDHAPEPSQYVESALDGRPNVYVGEYGWPLAVEPEGMEAVRLLTEVGLEWGAPWLLFWQTFDNELRREVDGRPTNDDVSGFCLVMPDGTRSAAREYFRGLFDRERAP